MTKILCLLACSFTASAATITLMPGAPFDVIVQATNVSDLVEAYGFNVTIANPSIFKYTGETAGALFTDVSSLFGGNPMVAGFATNPAGVSGPLTLATLHFSALQAGTTNIGVTSDSSDPNQGLVFANLPYGAISASTSLTAPAAVPEPGALGMLGVGLMGMLLVRKIGERDCQSRAD